MSRIETLFQSPRFATILLSDREVPTFDLSSYKPPLNFAANFVCPAHSIWTHLGSAKNCDICKLAKMRESPHHAVDHDEAKKRLEDREKYLTKIRYLENEIQGKLKAKSKLKANSNGM